MSRSFNGTSDEISLAPGACAALNGAITIAAIVKPTAFPSLLACLWDAGTTAGGGETAGYALNIDKEGYPVLSTQSASASATAGHTIVGEWALVAVTKPAGTSQIKTYTYKFSAATWLESTPSETLPNGAVAATVLGLGALEPRKVRFLNGALAVAGVWDSVLSKAQLETLLALNGSEQVRSWLHRWEELAPKGLWALNQGEVSEAVKDVTTGKADQSGISGTTVSSGEPVEYSGFPPVAAPPAGPLIDSFIRADESPLAKGWTFYRSSNSGAIVSNAAQIGSGGWWYWRPREYAAPVEVALDVIGLPGSEPSFASAAACVNGDPAKPNQYSFTYENGKARLVRVDGGVATTLAETAMTLEAGDSLGLTVKEGKLRGWRKRGGVWSGILVAADATYTHGWLGFGAFANTGSWRFGNFRGAGTVITHAGLLTFL